jgi:hypothetical protein
MLEYFNNCGSEINNSLSGFQCLDVSVNCDLASTWRGTNQGGTIKVTKLACYCCSIEDTELHHANPNHCVRFCQGEHNDDPDWKCYHHSMDDEVKLEEWMVVLNDMKQQFAVEISSIVKSSAIPLKKTKTSDRDLLSIWYKPKEHSQRNAYNKLLTDELILRQMDLPVQSNWIERRDILLEALEQEEQIRKLIIRIENCKNKEEAIFLVLECIPCILHCENYIGLKIFTMLFAEGLGNATEHLTFLMTVLCCPETKNT